MRGFDTMYTQAVYNGVITNVLYGTATINTLAMNGTISFPNNGAGLAWSTNSQIYDDSNLYISSNTNLLLYTPTTCIITTPNTSLSGSLTCTNVTCNSIKVNSTQQPSSGNYIGFYYKYQITLASSVTTSWTNLNSLSLFFSYTGVYIITATFTIDYTTNNGTQAFYYALSTTSTG